ncbi:MAG TPA: class I SAM-dependent methyltransferase [Stellaceae bacterium]|nr:class I SAM-dependent methyltransferase [Stellaceae bacterium]
MDSDAALRIRDIELRFSAGMHRPPPSSDDTIYVHKEAAFVAAMDEALARVRPRLMIEIGILDGGSAIYWHHRYDLRRLAAFDILPGAPALENYIARHELTDAFRLHLGVSQTDRGRLRAAIERDFGGEPVDAIVDDASHQYAETKAAFETIFPYLRVGGAYIIEDWAWGHTHNWPVEAWADKPLMSPLLCELMLVCGHRRGVIDRIDIDPRFAVIWRGPAELAKDGFQLSDHYAARQFSLAL